MTGVDIMSSRRPPLNTSGLILPGAVSHPPEGELPSHVVPTAKLFGSGPRRMKTPVTVKLSS
jgi:hypothetical protein